MTATERRSRSRFLCAGLLGVHADLNRAIDLSNLVDIEGLRGGACEHCSCREVES
jgi:hypothetical protein